MARRCSLCQTNALSASAVFYDVSYSDNGDWYPQYTVLVLCEPCLKTWIVPNFRKAIMIQRILDPVKG